MKTLLVIWLAVLVVGTFTIIKVNAWTSQGVNVYKTDITKNSQADWGGLVYDPNSKQFVSGDSWAGRVIYPNGSF